MCVCKTGVEVKGKLRGVISTFTVDSPWNTGLTISSLGREFTEYQLLFIQFVTFEQPVCNV